MHEAGDERSADIFWYSYMQSRMPSARNICNLSPEQRVNWVPGITAMTNKGKFALAYKKLLARRPSTQPFCPRQWVLPDESKEFEKHMRDTGSAKDIFVVKPSIGSRSAGIELMQGRHIDSAISSHALCSSFDRRKLKLSGRKEQYVAQEYISKLLLLKGHKFDLRLYVVVTSLYPLKVYLFGDGLARVCVSPYKPPEQSLKPTEGTAGGSQDEFAEQVSKKQLFADWKLSQLTNSSVNKKSGDYDYDSHKLTACPTLMQCLKDRADHESAIAATKSASASASTYGAEGSSLHAAACAAEVATSDPEAMAAGEEPEAAAAPSSSASATAADVSGEHASLWRRIDRVVWDTMVCIRPHLLNTYHGHLYSDPAAPKDSKPTPGLDFNLDECKPLLRSTGLDYRCFQVMGFDVIVDHALQPWLLEINSDPSLSVNKLSKADASIKKNVVKHCLLMVSAIQSGRDPSAAEVGGYRVLHDTLSDPLYIEHSATAKE